MLSLQFQELRLNNDGLWRDKGMNDVRMRNDGFVEVGVQVNYGSQTRRTRLVKLHSTCSAKQQVCTS